MANTTSKADEIVAVLRTEILTGQYRAGERLPSERDLAARFCANRGAIREAIKKLEQLGIAAVMPGGIRIVPVEEATLEVLGHLIDLDELARPDLIGQIFDVLGAMWSLSARSAVSAASDDDIDEMYRIVQNLIGSIGEQEENQRHLMELNDCCIAIHQNLVLRLVGNGLRTQFVDRLMNLDLQPSIDLDAMRLELGYLSEAILARNPNKVADAIIHYFQIVRDGILNPIETSTVPTDSQLLRRSTDHA